MVDNLPKNQKGALALVLDIVIAVLVVSSGAGRGYFYYFQNADSDKDDLTNKEEKQSAKQTLKILTATEMDLAMMTKSF